MRSAIFIGVVFDKLGSVKRIINPDFDWELLAHHVGEDEFMLRIRKSDFHISNKSNSMTIDDVHRIKRALSP